MFDALGGTTGRAFVLILGLNAFSTSSFVLIDFLTPSSTTTGLSGLKETYCTLYRQADRKSPRGGLDHSKENWARTNQ